MHSRRLWLPGIIACVLGTISAQDPQPGTAGQDPPATWDDEAFRAMWNKLFGGEGTGKEASGQSGQAAVVPAGSGTVQDPEVWTVLWDNGLTVTSPDRKFDVRFGGRVMIDWSWISADDELETIVDALDPPPADGDPTIEDGAEIRRARLFAEGTLYENIVFKLQYDFAGGDAAPKDVFVGMKNIPVAGTFIAGQHKEAFSLETLTSSNFITFMERALPVEAFSPERNTGFSVFNTVGADEQLFWALGFFRDTSADGSGSGDGEYNGVARLSGVPWEDGDGSRLAHVGASVIYNTDGSIRHRARPEDHLVPQYVDTMTLATDSEVLLDLEAAVVFDALSLQGEYIWDDIDLDGAGSSTLSGWYAYVSYFLTGEHRNFRKARSAFDRVSPIENFDMKGGSGAWEVAARYSYLDLQDGPVMGGDQYDITLGVNWYLNPNTRIMLNYVHADAENMGLDGKSDSFAMRFQIDF